ncbi:heavy metal-binding domain-containing protein, partial [uncultured Maricaulis sp.]|uniref:heavy metal-binding domain-containing protein n=1 Tax=uncultured Maricaulis sp. TaxID=174710 RepID=UPI0030DB5AB8
MSCQHCTSDKADEHMHHQPVATDPVCGMEVRLGAGKPSYEHAGDAYHFCSQRCHDRFAEDPEHFLSGAHRDAYEDMPAGTTYTCPMDPEIIRDEPGDCPICGMALEPMGVPTGQEGPNPELIDFTRRFWFGAALTLPVLILSLWPLLGLAFLRDACGEPPAAWADPVLVTSVFPWTGWPFFARPAKSNFSSPLST